MAILYVNTGSSANKGDGDNLRTAFTKINANFAELSAAISTSSTSTVAGIVVSITPPVNPIEGEIWWNADTGIAYMYYTDEDSGQWVSISSPGIGFSVSTSTVTTATLATYLQGNGLESSAVGFRIIPQKSKSTDYTLIASDSGKHILHPSSDGNSRTFTIPSNSNVAYPLGTEITFVNQSTQTVFIAINSDSLILANIGSTGTRSLAQYGIASILKIEPTVWYIRGDGLL